MTGYTNNGIRYPNDPNAYADLIQFFLDMATDVDTKFIPKAGDQAMTGTLASKYLISSNGGTTQSATVLQTGLVPSSAFTIYDDNVRIDGVSGRRLWIAGANGTDVAIRTKSDSENLNRISMRASTIDINGAVTINGTINVTGMRASHPRWETNQTLAANKTTWTPLPAAPGFTFVAPPSGQVTLGFGAMLPTYDKTSQITYRVKTGATLGQGNLVMDTHPSGWNFLTQPPPHSISANGVPGSEQWASVYTPFILGTSTNANQVLGLVAGQTYNVVPYYINQNATKALTLFRIYFIVTPDL